MITRRATDTAVRSFATSDARPFPADGTTP
jgi:hypothetical protein